MTPHCIIFTSIHSITHAIKRTTELKNDQIQITAVCVYCFSFTVVKYEMIFLFFSFLNCYVHCFSIVFIQMIRIFNSYFFVGQ